MTSARNAALVGFALQVAFLARARQKKREASDALGMLALSAQAIDDVEASAPGPEWLPVEVDDLTSSRLTGLAVNVRLQNGYCRTQRERAAALAGLGAEAEKLLRTIYT